MSNEGRKIETRGSSKKVKVEHPTPLELIKNEALSKNKSSGQKRPMPTTLFSMGFKKEDKKEDNSIIAEPTEMLYSVKELLKQVTIKEILEQCPKVANLYEQLSSKPFIKKNLVERLLDKYFHANTTSLWMDKYAPREFNEIFQSDFAEKIEEWIKDFYYFRKDTDYDDEFDFIDDEIEEDFSRSLQMRMKENGWNCKALVLKGRGGSGKTTFLNAIAKSMGIKCFEFASDVDQLKKMKELFDGSNSEVVVNFQNKKKEVENNKIIKQNNSITKFLPPTATKEALDTKQPKRMQIFKDFSLYFPPYEKIEKQGVEEGYLKYLFDSINKSPIPYVLTTNDFEFSFKEKALSEKFSKFDQIEFVESTVEDLAGLYWVIFQIELNLKLDSSKKIRKRELFIELNSQLESSSFKVIENIQTIRQLVISSNKKPLYISNFLQFEVMSILKSSKENGDQVEMKLLENAIKKIGHEVVENITPHDLINNIEWDFYEKAVEENNTLELTAAEENEKYEKDKVDCEEFRPFSKLELREIRMKLECDTILDRKVFQNEYYHLKKEEDKYDDPFMNIPIETHVKAKKEIAKNIKNRKRADQVRFNMKEDQFYYLPLLFHKRKSSRSLKKHSKESLFENLGKLMNSRELSYMQKFGKLFFSEI